MSNIENLHWLYKQLNAEAEEQGIGQGSEGARYCLAAADEIESLRQQLAAALAAIKIKNHTLEWLSVKSHTRLQRLRATQALAIQPDDDALKAWIGEPVAWMITYDGKCMGFVPTEEANTVAVYSPKGLK